MVRSGVLLAGALLCASPSQAAGPFGSIHTGFWVGGAYTNDNTGQFQLCGAAHHYGSGINVIVSQTATGNWVLGFTHASWRFIPHRTYPLMIILDGQAPLNLAATASNRQEIVAMFPTSAIEQLQQASVMSTTVNGQTFQLSMASVNELVPAIANCVAQVKARGVETAGDFSGPSAPPAAAAATTPAPHPAPPSQAAPAAKVAQVTGTGFLINKSGDILTNNHVIAECTSEVHGNLAGESPETLRVVSHDQNTDLALLHGSMPVKDVAVIRGPAIHAGDPVVAVGYPYHGILTSDITVSTGIVNSLSGLLNDTRYLQISAPVQPGNSGGPLFDTSGRVVGIVSAKLNALKIAKATGDIPENINFAIKPGAVRDFLDNSVVAYSVDDGAPPELKTSQIVTNARAYTMLISCTVNQEDAAKK